MHIREAAVDAVVADGELLVIDAEQVHHRGVDVVAGRRIGAVERLVAPLVALAGGDAALDAAAAEPVGEDVRVVVAAFAALRAGMRPNSVVQRMIVSSSRPRCFRSRISAETAFAMPQASGP
jgi:hypothetical protein